MFISAILILRVAGIKSFGEVKISYDMHITLYILT